MLRVIISSILLLSFTTASFAQQNRTGKENVTSLMPEKILVHSDKDFYIAGEIMWYKIYIINASTGLSQSLSKTAYIGLYDQNGKFLLQSKVAMNDGFGYGSFLIPTDATSGNYNMQVYTAWMKNNPSSVFSKNITIVNTGHTFDTSAFTIINTGAYAEAGTGNSPTDSRATGNVVSSAPGFDIEIKTDKQEYQQRSPVDIDITALKDGAGISSNLSVAVYKVNDLTTPDNGIGGIPVSFNIPSDSKGTEGFPFLPDMNGYVVTVKVRNIATGKNASSVPVMVSLTGKLTDVQYGESDENGFVYFNLKNVFGPHQILVKTLPEFENTVDLQIVRPYLPALIVPHAQKPVLKSEFVNSVEEMHNNMVINKAFDSTWMNQFYPTNADSISFYGKPYKTYLLDNYKRFVTMEEVLREYVQEVNVRIRNKNYFLLIFNRQFFDLHKYMELVNMMDKFSPLVLLDGVPVTDLNKIIKYDPLKVRKLEVVADRYIIGKETYDGILSFTTYEGDFEDLELNKKELLFEEQGWQYHRKFFVPDYKDLAVKNSRNPDFRELLYWAPEVITTNASSGKISFYTGDLTGKFVVVVKGVSTDGRVGSKIAEFEVVR